MGSIKSFPSPDGGGSHVIERLEEALEMAKSGQIANVMVVMVGFDNNVMHGWANQNRPTLVIGEMQCAMHEFVAAATQRRGEQ